MSQGVVKCWVEINPVNVNPEYEPKEFDISKKPPYPVEVRVVVHNCENIPMMDMEGTIDAFFRGFFDTKEEVQETDCHYRNQDGKPDFQYRMKFNVNQPKTVSQFTLQGYDRDFFSSNEMFGEASFPLEEIMEDVSLCHKPLGINKEYYDKVLKDKYPELGMKFKDSTNPSTFWLTLHGKDKKTNKIEQKGEVRLTVDVIPQEFADKNEVGKARDNPNHSPMLPQPAGRLELSLNPLKMLNQLVGPALRRKLYMACCGLVCIGLCILVLPQIMGGIMLKVMGLN